MKNYRSIVMLIWLAGYLLQVSCQVNTTRKIRQIIDFNHDWQFIRLDDEFEVSSKENINSLYDTSRTDFISQFLNEYIQSEGTDVSEIIREEAIAANLSFRKEYPVLITKHWTEVVLPHTARVEPVINKKNTWEGICYYRRSFTPAKSWRRKKLFLEFNGAMQQSDIYVNGQLVMQHKGGYTPFSIDLSQFVHYDRPNKIIVRLDNRAHKNFPVGKDLKRNGFTYWSGLYRRVFLHVTNPVYITNAVKVNKTAGGGVFFRTPEVSSTRAVALIRTNVVNQDITAKHIKVQQILRAPSGKIVSNDLSQEILLENSKDTHFLQRFAIANPLLWHPDHPYLYTLETIVFADDIEVDEFTQRVGFRSLSFSRKDGFKINNESIYMTGTNRHQDYPFIGIALPQNAHFRDMKRIKQAGYNTVRLAHYPQDPAIYAAADELGLMLLNGVPGWQFFNNNAIFKQRVYRDIRDMIHRDRNHPSVILWEPNLNEAYPSDEFRKKCHLLAHEELPVGEYFTAGETYGAKKTYWDVAINNWSESADSIFRNTTERAQNVQPEAPGFIKEYGDWEFGGWTSTTRSSRAAGEKSMLQGVWNTMWEFNANIANYSPYTVGSCTWAMYDNYLSSDHKLYEWGTADYFRLPKFTEFLFKSQLEPYKQIAGIEDNNPLIFIANWWTPRKHKSKVVIFSNCDKIRLRVNGTIVGEQEPDNGPNSYYGVPEKGGNPFDGGNCRSLEHPPFTFRNIVFEPGELKAEGYIKGIKVAESTVSTPDKPLSLLIQADLQGRPLDAEEPDAVFVHASIVDQNRVVSCLDNSTKVDFFVTGDAEIPGATSVKARGGIASILLRSYPGKHRKIKITARAEGLKTGILILDCK